MTKNELVKKIENGRDILFDVCGKHYTILTWCEKGIGIDEQHPNDTDLTYYATAKDLVENFKVNGIPLENLAAEVRITDYS